MPALPDRPGRRRRLAVHRPPDGEAGRNGNTVGTYICADLGCSDRVRTEIPPWLQLRDPDEVVAERAAELRGRAEGFLDAVRR